MTVITDEDAAQIERLRYVLAQSVKEGLVERLAQWPGVHCVEALLEGEALTGHWFDRTQEFAARLRREDFGRMRYTTVETVTLSLAWEKVCPVQTRNVVLRGFQQSFCRADPQTTSDSDLAVYASQAPLRDKPTQDSLPAGGQPLPGRILTCRVPFERFPLCQLLPTSLPPFPGLAWRTDLGSFYCGTPPSKPSPLTDPLLGPPHYESPSRCAFNPQRGHKTDKLGVRRPNI
jgi:hypothetical protein